MTRWIREADGASTAASRGSHTVGTSRSRAIQSTLTTKMRATRALAGARQHTQSRTADGPARGERGGQAIEERSGRPGQVTLDRHFMKTDPTIALYSNSPEDNACNTVGDDGHGLDLVIETDDDHGLSCGERPPSSKKISKRRRSSGSWSPRKKSRAMTSNDFEDLPALHVGAEDETQPLPWSPSLSIKSPSLASPLRSPKKVRARPRANAISPSKRRSLIEQSAKEVAVRQHMQSVGSSSSTSHIYLHRSPSILLQSPSPLSTSPKEAQASTPSPLRAGFSLIDLSFTDQMADKQDDEADESNSDTAEEELLSSPLGGRSTSLGRFRYALSPSSKRRIYAFETQPQDLPREFNDSMNLVATSAQDTDRHAWPRAPDNARHQDGDKTSSSTLSPPPELDPKHESSQTESGASWAAQRTADSDVKDENDVERGETHVSGDTSPDEVGDSTYQDSQFAGDLTLLPCKITRSVSTSKSPSGQTVEKGLTQTQACADARKDDDATSSPLSRDADSQTQPLPWLASEQQPILKGQDTSPNERQELRKPRQAQAGWADVEKVWSSVLTDCTNAEVRIHEGRCDLKSQSSLTRFGFASVPARRAEAAPPDGPPSPMSDPEEVCSDDGQIDDDYVDSQVATCPSLLSTGQRKLRLDTEVSNAESETQSLTWNEDENENGNDNAIVGAEERIDALEGARQEGSDHLSVRRHSSHNETLMNADSSQCSLLSVPSDSSLDVGLRSFLTSI